MNQPLAIELGTYAPTFEIDLPKPQPPSSASARPSKRRRLWETATVHHCVLLGAAFDARELRQLFRLAGYSGWETSSDYELHSSAVSLAAEANAFSRLVQRKLDTRYDAAISAFRNLDRSADLVSAWRAWSARGEAIAAYWAAISDPACSISTSETLSREMHMLAHSTFFANRAAARRIHSLESASTSLGATLQRAQSQCQNLRAELGRARAEVRDLQAQLRGARAAEAKAREERDAAWRAATDAVQWRARCEELAGANAAALTQLAKERRLVAKLRARIDWLHARSGERAPEACSCPADVAADAGSAEINADDLDLGGRCVLCVGGRAALVPRYRTLVEEAKASFLHHDGGREDHLGRLPALLSSAHMVICFAGDVSHAAYHAVKRYCKVRNTPCELVAQSGVHAATRALAALGTRAREEVV